MIFEESKYSFMKAALKEAEKAFYKDETPIGAVITYENKIISRGFNQVETLKDATAHAEMIAITSAANYLQEWRLNDCELYVTVEPCLMCTGAILLSRIKTIYFGICDPKFGACGSIYNAAEEGKLNHKVKVFSGLMSEECEMLMKQFFLNKRILNQPNNLC